MALEKGVVEEAIFTYVGKYMPVTVRQAIKIVERDGWYFVRMKGSHRHYHHPTKGGTVTIAGPPKRDLPAKTWRDIRHQAGLK